MINELLFVVAVAVDLLFITLAARFGRGGLTLAMAVNMILVSTFAPKLIGTFGLLSNVGNIFYGSLLLASNLLIERYGKRAAYHGIWLSFSANILFVTMSQFALRFLGDAASAAQNDAITALFSITPRIALASIVAYLTVQYCNVWLYSYLKEKTSGRMLWMRHIASAGVSQFLDSILFFSVAFFGVIPDTLLFQAMAAGFLLKTVIGIVSTPLLYGAPTTCAESDSEEDAYVA